MKNLETKLSEFVKKEKFKGKGPLCVALVVTRHAMKRGLPLDPDDLLTDGGGQVLGLGKSSVQSILKTHGIHRVLAAEGGRTSRGSIGKMRKYVEFLNQETLDLKAAESFWIQEVHKFFAGKPFKIRIDAAVGLRAAIREVLSQAEDRQKASDGMQYTGAVMQHLVGAKLECALGEKKFEHNSFSTSDQQSGRAGDFLIGDVAVHVTTSPGEAVIERCRDNLHDNLKTVIITNPKGVVVAESLANNVGLADRIDIFEITQFVALNIYELGSFLSHGRKTALQEIVGRYNEIVEEFETDPSLKIELRK